MNKKKLLFTAVVSAITLSCTAGAIDFSKSESSEAEKIMQQTGMQLISLTDEPVQYDKQKTVPYNPADEIEAVTGMRLISLTDSPVQYVPVTSFNGDIVRATTPPTKEAESYPYEQNWSGTVNYTFTKRYFSTGILGGNFDAYASGKFYADYYKSDGTYLGGIASTKDGNRYKIISRVRSSDSDYYYVILTNQSGSASQNATYIADLAMD